MAGLALLAGLSGCSERQVIPRPTPTPTPTSASRLPPALPAPVTPHAPATARPAAPPPRAPAATGWIDLPATPGNWVWRPLPGGSQAVFADGQFTLRCDAVARTVTLIRAGTASGPATMTVSTTGSSRSLTAQPQADGLSAVLTARDPLLDAMAFSRGRFAIAVPGMPLLTIPNWAEVGRVIEDCR
ncbi:hypothetical protein [Novosphingobium colocasiae]|uniref:hypothetical protein n=1 Tax=Novosphingobium colocasiae TaxID=1256513 RepID=UPI0035ADC827